MTCRACGSVGAVSAVAVSAMMIDEEESGREGE